MNLEIWSFHKENDNGEPYTRLNIFLDSCVTLKCEPVVTLLLPGHKEIFMSDTKSTVYYRGDPIPGVCKCLVSIRESYNLEEEK